MQADFPEALLDLNYNQSRSAPESSTFPSPNDARS